MHVPAFVGEGVITPGDQGKAPKDGHSQAEGISICDYFPRDDPRPDSVGNAIRFKTRLTDEEPVGVIVGFGFGR